MRSREKKHREAPNGRDSKKEGENKKKVEKNDFQEGVRNSVNQSIEKNVSCDA